MTTITSWQPPETAPFDEKIMVTIQPPKIAGGYQERPYVCIGWFHAHLPKVFSIMSGSYSKVDYVKAWMPLPDPYQEEQ